MNTDKYPCDWKGCNRSFDTAQGLRVHRLRAHTKPWNTTENLANRWANRDRTLSRKSKWKSPAYRRRKYREQVDRYHALGLNAHGQPYTNSNVSLALQKLHRVKRRMEPYVYPLPEKEQPEPQKPQLTPDVKNYVRATLMHFCPKCGHDLHQWELTEGK